MRFLFLLFIVIPVFEMWLLLKVGGLIGVLPTIGLVVLTAFIGAALLRREGLKTLWRGRQRLESGQLPAREMLEGMILAICGALLLTPGFATDCAGFAGLIPISRHWLVGKLMANATVRSFSVHQTSTTGAEADSQVIEAEYWREKNND